jgi:inner membrane protein
MVYAAGLGLLATSPDLDLIGFFAGMSYSDAFGHRGIFHSLPFAALVAAFTVALMAPFRARLTFKPLRAFPLVFVAVASHGLLDAMTNGGLGVGFFLPLYPGRFFLPFRPIEVAAIHPASFLPKLATVMASELLWVWLPVATMIVCVELCRRGASTPSPAIDEAPSPRQLETATVRDH